MDFIPQEENCLFVPFQSSAHLSTSHHRSFLCHWSFFLGANSSSWVSRPELPVSTKECLGVLQEGWPGFKEQERWLQLNETPFSRISRRQQATYCGWWTTAAEVNRDHRPREKDNPEHSQYGEPLQWGLPLCPCGDCSNICSNTKSK